MKLNRILATLLALILIPGCVASSEKPQSSTVDNMVALQYYTIGNPDPDLPVINDALNELLAKKIGVQVEYRKIAWSEYGSYLANLINSGSDFDIAFATTANQGDFVGNAKAGVWLPLDDYLTTAGKEMYDLIDPLFWDGMRIDGKIYGVPTNKEIAVPTYWVYPKELIDRYGLDISDYKTLESLEPLFEMIHENEPDYLTMELSCEASNFFALQNYEYIINFNVPLMLRSDDQALELVNIFDTDFGALTLKTLRRYYEKGFINTDAALREAGALEQNKKVLWFASSGGPYSETSWSKDRGYPLVAEQVSDSFVNSESVRGGTMVVNSHTRYPEECIRFLNCLNTDPEVRNLLNYGIEGRNYKLTDADQIEVINADYAGVQYTQGNWFILKTVVGDPLDKWDTYHEFNKSAIKSVAMGFTPELTAPVTADYISKISAVTKRYYAPLLTGTVDPDIVLPQFRSALTAAGIDPLRVILQAQLDTWKAAEG